MRRLPVLSNNTRTVSFISLELDALFHRVRNVKSEEEDRSFATQHTDETASATLDHGWQ